MKEIDIRMIRPHPHNPRKNLGDLAELTDSIRTFGVLQNLTVVQNEADGYTVICGHRRLAAAEAAGLDTVPCIIAEDMDEKTQLSIMLLENMQRSDLTVQEEAQGFQMMLELGSSIPEIVKETGLSETKVRHRVKMNELDQDVLTEKLGQISINELISLEQIKDIDKRNEILELAGTNNFEWKLNEAVRKEKREETIDLIRKLYPEAKFADGYSWQYQTCKRRLRTGSDKNEVDDFMKELKAEEERREQKALILPGTEEFIICFEHQQQTASEDPEQTRRREERDRRNEQLKEMRDRILGSWDGFMREYCTKSESHIRKSESVIITALIEGFMSNPYCDEDDAAEILGEDSGNITGLKERPWASLAAIAYALLSPGKYQNTWEYSYQTYDADSAVSYIRTAGYLGELGYRVSDDEAGFIHGSSSLYKEKDQ